MIRELPDLRENSGEGQGIFSGKSCTNTGYNCFIDVCSFVIGDAVIHDCTQWWFLFVYS